MLWSRRERELLQYKLRKGRLYNETHGPAGHYHAICATAGNYTSGVRTRISPN